MTTAYQVLFGSVAADTSFYSKVSSIEVEENADLPGAIQIVLSLATASNDLTVLGDDHLQPYARIAVVTTAGGSDACIFDGYVLSHKIRLDPGTTESTVRVWGQDVSCMMNLTDRARAWTSTDGNTANTIFNEHSITPSDDNLTDDSSDYPLEKRVLMQRGTDAQFLRDRAHRAGKLFRVCCDARAGQNTGYFIKPKTTGDAIATLVMNPAVDANVGALDFEWDVARPTQVVANALFATKDASDGGKQDSGLDLLDQRSLATFAGSANAMTTRLTAAADSAGDLSARAAALLREAGWFVRCEGEVDLARLGKVLRAATLVQINGAGTLHSGKYFVWSVRHVITQESYRMRFTLVRNAIGAA